MIRLHLTLAYRLALWTWVADRGEGWVHLALGPLVAELEW